MKADPFVQLRLLDLQALDSALRRLAHRRRTLPELAAIEKAEAAMAAARDDLTRAETTMSDLAREQRKFEQEIDVVRTRRARDEQRMASGAITQSKQLADLQHEVGSLVRRQTELEDRELEVMERAEGVQAELDALLAQRAGQLQARDEAAAARDLAWSEIDADVARTTTDRAALAAGLPADLLALHDKIAMRESGVGTAAIAQRRCGGCRLELLGNEVAEFRAAAPDLVLHHEECGRILVRTAESGL